MLHTIQKQQEQINSFMLNTQVDLKQLENALDQRAKETQARIQEQYNIKKQSLATPALVHHVASALQDRKQQDRRDLYDQQQPSPASLQQQNFFHLRNQGRVDQGHDLPVAHAQVPLDNHVQRVQSGAGQPLQTPDFSAQPPQLSYIDRKLQKNEKLSALWLQISKLAFEQDYQRAYELALTQADDIYLLRLIMQTGPVISRGLTDSVAKKVLQRLNRIVRGGAFYKLQIDWLDDSRKTEVFRNLSHAEQNEYMDTLYQFANPKSELVKKDLKERAAEVYTVIKN